MPRVVRLLSSSGRAVVGKLAKRDITAMTVTGVGCPSAEDTFGAVGLATYCFPLVESVMRYEWDNPRSWHRSADGASAVRMPVLEIADRDKVHFPGFDGRFLGPLTRQHASPRSAFCLPISSCAS